MALPGAGTLDLGRHDVPTIVYALVARGPTILAEHATTTGNFQSITQEILQKLPAGDDRRSYLYDKHIFHILCDQGLVYIVMCDEAMGRRVPFVLLDDMKNRWRQAYGDRGRTAAAHAMNDDFGVVLRRLVEQYGNPQSDKVRKVQGEIDEVKQVMTQNIEKVLARGEKIELLVDRTELLNASALRFKRGATSLKRAMWYKNARLLLALFGVICLIIYFVVATACGGLLFPNC